MAFAIFIIIVLLFSTIIHEIAHGSVANLLGDPTAKNAGRLTLNPLKHLDPFGSVILPLLLLLVTAGRGPVFGWAKPVPVNPFNFRDRKWGALKVSIAGPAANFLVGLIFSLLTRFFPSTSPMLLPLSVIAFYNFLWAIFNLLPIPPLDGSWILFTFLPERFSNLKMVLTQYGTYILIFFIFFGLSWVSIAAGLLFYLLSGRNILL